MKKLSMVLIFAFSCVFGMQTGLQRGSGSSLCCTFEEFISSRPPNLPKNAEIIALEGYIFLQCFKPTFVSVHKTQNTRTRRQKRNTISAKGVRKKHAVSESKPFVCKGKGCNSAYGSIYRLKYHMERYHPELVRLIQSYYMLIRPYKCEYCDFAFNDKNHLDSHILTMHEGIKRITCTHCGKRYEGSLRNKKKHRRICFLG